MRLAGLIAILLLSAPAPASAAAGMARMAVIVGNNEGLAEEKVLRFAAQDAANVAATLEQLGGVDPGQGRVLLDGSPADLMRALDEARGRIASLRSRGAKVQLLIYYSGHGSEEALHMNGARLPVARIRETFRGLEADLKILIADACFSGALLREKGGSLAGPVPVTYRDELKVNGSAILTSSSAGELSQESQELRGSLFTHYFLSAIRGAGDADRDGSVSLWEAYAHTLAAMRRKLAASGRDQNPEFEVDLKGSEDVVLTRVKLGRALLSLKGVPEGRYQVLEEPGARPVAEAEVRDAEGVTLALPKGRYLVYRHGAREGASSRADLRVQPRVTLAAGDFLPAASGSMYAKGMAPPEHESLTPFRLVAQPRAYLGFPARGEETAWAIELGLQADRGPWALLASWQRVGSESLGYGHLIMEQEGIGFAAEARRYLRAEAGFSPSAGARFEHWTIFQRSAVLGKLGRGRALGAFACFGVEARVLRVLRLRLAAEPGYFWTSDGGGALRRDFSLPFAVGLGVAP